MPNLIKFPARRDNPDAEHIYRDFRTHRVDTMYRYLGSYEFDGEQWQIEIWARDFDEACRKLKAVANGHIGGQIFSTVDI
ncbi:MAG: hypothetical protein K8H87_16420 [Pseudorhodoplanes sp.]|nr:hypothetical protein [Pseudorhodoplanes sp.]